MFKYNVVGAHSFLTVATIDVFTLGVNPKSFEVNEIDARADAELIVRGLVPVIILLALNVPFTVRLPATVPPLRGK